jgi:hypothetical protein
MAKIYLKIDERGKKKKQFIETFAEKQKMLFKKSLDQLLYNSILEDKHNYGRDMVNFFLIYRQLKYETILNNKINLQKGDSAAEAKFTNEAREFLKPIKFMGIKLKG